MSRRGETYFQALGLFATIGVDLYCTLIRGTSDLVRGSRPGVVRDPGDDPGDGRSVNRCVGLGERSFPRALSSPRDGCARGYCGGRSGVPAGSGGGQARF